MTAPINLAVSFTFGVSLALASRAHLSGQSTVRALGIWVTVIVQAFVVCPIGVYLLHNYPQWSLMYLVEPGALPLPVEAIAALYPLAALAGFLAARRLLLVNRLVVTLLLCLAGVAAIVAIFVLGPDRILQVGTPAAAGLSANMRRPLTQTPLVYLLSVALPVIFFSWGSAVWRLQVYARANRAHRERKAPTLVREVSQKANATHKPAKSRG